MFVSKAEYRVREEFIDRNLANIRAYLPEVRNRLKPGSVYSVAMSEDRRTFLHLFLYSEEEEAMMLGEIPAFLTFLQEVMEGGYESPPTLSELREI